MRYTLLLFGILAPTVAGQVIERESVGQGGTQSNSLSERASISGDARYVAFASAANNLVPSDTNGHWDVFVRDRFQGTTTRVSVGPQGRQGDHHSYGPSISARGRNVAFVSTASTLVAGDTAGTWDVFVHDRNAGLTQCVSRSLSGTPGTGVATYPAISFDGRLVAFQSDAQDLVAGPQSGSSQIYVRDTSTGTTECISVMQSGMQAPTWSAWPSISATGRYVAFVSSAALDGGSSFQWGQVFVRDRVAGTTIRASRNTAGAEANGVSDSASISYDGRFVAFRSIATNLGNPNVGNHYNVYLRDLHLGTTAWVSHGPGEVEPDGSSELACVSPSGRFVSFTTIASNILHGDADFDHDVFRWDRIGGQMRLVSADAGGAWGNGNSAGWGMTINGRVVFDSDSTNLVPGDTNGAKDVFLKAPGLIP